ncbi:ETS domain-containing protein [Endozoicomonas sp. ONNA2]|uniref:ETS domain-containing protein n=1 Tax=Endozoicomonas sp. ONNA2 TaxID=2828741 RepID=UPI002147D78F|nr:ETS domain-containing protein [Endozoicomonas sp. ONNA2]
MSNPVSTNDKTVNNFDLTPPVNTQFIKKKYPVTGPGKQKSSRYSPYNITNKILISDPLRPRDDHPSLALRQLKIVQGFNQPSVPDSIQNPSNDYPNKTSWPCEPLHEYFKEWGIDGQTSHDVTVQSPLGSTSYTQDAPETLDADCFDTASLFNTPTQNLPDEYLLKEIETLLNIQQDKGTESKFTRQPEMDLSGNTPNTSQHSLKISQRTSKTIVRQKTLLDFILNKLNSGSDSVRWLNSEQGVFQFTDTDKFSNQWSSLRNKKISFDSIKRAIRAHYSCGIIFRFDNHGNDLPINQFRFDLSHPYIVSNFKSIVPD